jgi:hypothetical protein
LLSTFFKILIFPADEFRNIQPKDARTECAFNEKALTSRTGGPVMPDLTLDAFQTHSSGETLGKLQAERATLLGCVNAGSDSLKTFRHHASPYSVPHSIPSQTAHFGFWAKTKSFAMKYWLFGVQNHG